MLGPILLLNNYIYHCVDAKNVWLILTLSYLSEGSPALAVLRHVKTCLKLTTPGFRHNLLSVSCSDIGFFKKA